MDAQERAEVMCRVAKGLVGRHTFLVDLRQRPHLEFVTEQIRQAEQAERRKAFREAGDRCMREAECFDPGESRRAFEDVAACFHGLADK